MDSNSNIEIKLGHFLRESPFVLHGVSQDPNILKRALVNESSRFQEIGQKPLISLVVLSPGEPQPNIEKLVESCFAQSWPYWNLWLIGFGEASVPSWARNDPRIKTRSCRPLGAAFKQASGEFVGVLDANGRLHPQALGIFARFSLVAPATELIYCNELLTSHNSITEPLRAKPPFDRATLIRTNFLGRLTLFKRSVIDSIEDTWSEYEILLHISESASLIATHLPIFAYFREQNDHSSSRYQDDKVVLKSYLSQKYPQYSPVISSSIRTKGSHFHGVQFQPTEGQTVGVIIPFRNRFDLTRRCLEALERQVVTLKVRVLLVDNDSSLETKNSIREWLQSPRRHEYSSISYSGAFNFAKINNLAASKLEQAVDFLLLLNNDVELISENAIQTMAGELEVHQQTGFVGLKLWYPGKFAIQHGGIRIVATTEGLGFHRTQHMSEAEELVHDEHVVAAVTFACAMCRIRVWKELGGLEEVFFPNGYGDVDLCLRAIAAGYHNFYFGSLEGIHHESQTRKTNSEECELAFINERHGELFQYWSRRTLGGKIQSNDFTSWAEKPLRYRIADFTHIIAKALTGRWYRYLKQLIEKQIKASNHEQ